MNYKHKPTIIDAIEVQARNLMDIEDFVGNGVSVEYVKDRLGKVTYTITQVDKVVFKVFPGYYLIKNKDGISFNVMSAGEFEYNYEEAD